MKFVCFISRSPSNRICFINSIVTLQIVITSHFIAPVNVSFSWNEIFTTQWPAKLSLMQNVCASPPCLLLHAKPVMAAWVSFQRGSQQIITELAELPFFFHYSQKLSSSVCLPTVVSCQITLAPVHFWKGRTILMELRLTCPCPFKAGGWCCCRIHELGSCFGFFFEVWC